MKKSVSVNPPIIFEDQDMIVIDKPCGVVVNRADSVKGETIQDWTEQKVHSSQFTAGSEFVERGGIVHRLDKDTSGVLVIAKNPEAFLKLKNEFKERRTVKKYLALVHSKVEPPVGTIDAPIERSPYNRMQFGVFPGGREAVTKYKLIKVYRLQTTDYSLLEVEPKTGRTHQIRVHMKYIGHPIVSDPIYGGRKQSKEDLKICLRLFLHATELQILGKTFKSPLPEELKGIIQPAN